MLVRVLHEEGSGPVRRFSNKLRLVRPVKAPQEEGREPKSRLANNCKELRPARELNEPGRDPLRHAACNVIPVIMKAQVSLLQR